jgi:hypothetical protein
LGGSPDPSQLIPLAILAETISVCAVPAFIFWYVPAGRAGIIIVIDTLVRRLVDFIDGIKRIHFGHFYVPFEQFRFFGVMQ